MNHSEQSQRKDEHLFLAEKYFQPQAAAGFDQVRFIHDPLPETSVAAVDLSSANPFGWHWPLYINAMTGGSEQTGNRNAQLGRIAKAADVAVASGSQSVALKQPELEGTFTPLRAENPAGFVLANLGANQTPAGAKKAIAMLQANALEIHLNAAQEIVMPEGDRTFYWQANLKQILEISPVPVIVKEVGFGMSQEGLQKLQALGAQYVDIGGRGGTNFAVIENARRASRDYSYLADFGQTTVESLLEASSSRMTILATGGIRTPLDALKALRLGASAAGLAGLVLHWLVQDGEEAAVTNLLAFEAQMQALMALLGAEDLQTLRQVPIIYSPALLSYAQQRGIKLP